MSQREINSLAKILSDPENSSRTAEEVAALVLEKMYDLAVSTAKAEIRTEERADIRRQIFERDTAVRRLAVVGQITFGPQEAVHTVVLGPFYAPHQLSSEEKFREAVAKPCRDAREAGQRLAWDYKTGTNRGRFMLAPAFMKPSEAWDFYRGEATAQVIEKAAQHQILRDIVPVCSCGLKSKPPCIACGRAHERFCPQHEPEKAAHACREAA